MPKTFTAFHGLLDYVVSFIPKCPKKFEGKYPLCSFCSLGTEANHGNSFETVTLVDKTSDTFYLAWLLKGVCSHLVEDLSSPWRLTCLFFQPRLAISQG